MSKPRATFWLQATPGVNYYRAELPARHLPGACAALSHRDMFERPDGVIEMPRQHGASIWLFPGNSTRALIMAQLRTMGFPVLADVDDNYTRHPAWRETTTWSLTMAEAKPDGVDRHSYEEHQKIVQKVAQAVVCSTPYLADRYRRLNPNVHVARNAVDPADWPEVPPHQEDGILRIGWAASDSHKYDAPLVARALEWASSQKDVEVVILGIQPEVHGFRFPHVQVPFQDRLRDYRRELKRLDVALCPLKPSPWADCKSDCKALEAAMAGALPVVGRTEPYRPWWDRTFVADEESDWRRILKHLVRNREEVKQMAREAGAYCLQSRNIRETVSEWEDAITSAEELAVAA